MRSLCVVLETGNVQLVREALCVIEILMAHGELLYALKVNLRIDYHVSEVSTDIMDDDFMMNSLFNVLKDGEPLGLRVIALVAAQGVRPFICCSPRS